jgi:hypothetical protein
MTGPEITTRGVDLRPAGADGRRRFSEVERLRGERASHAGSRCTFAPAFAARVGRSRSCGSPC